MLIKIKLKYGKYTFVMNRVPNQLNTKIQGFVEIK